MHIDNGALVGGVIGSISILPVSAGDVPFKAMAITIVDADDTPALTYQNYKFIQTEELTALGVAVHPYGAIIVPDYASAKADAEKVIVEFNGNKYGIDLITVFEELQVNASITFEHIEEGGGGGGGDNSN